MPWEVLRLSLRLMPSSSPCRTMSGHCSRQAIARASLERYTSGIHGVRFPTSRKISTEQACQTARSLPKVLTNEHSTKTNTPTLLHKTGVFLPKVLPSQEKTAEPLETLEFWSGLLLGAHDDLNSATHMDKARVVVLGMDECSASEEFVTSLLEDPFASDDTSNKTLHFRWHSTDRSRLSRVVEFGPVADGKKLHLLSPYLNQFTLPLQLNELSNRLPFGSLETLTTLFKADVPVIICNPLSTSLDDLSSLLKMLRHSNAILVLVSQAPSTELVANSQDPVVKSLRTIVPRVLLINPWRALKATEALKSDLGSNVSVQRYQDGIIGSGIPAFSASLKSIFDQVNLEGSQSAISGLRVQTALSHIRGSLSACERSIQRTKGEIDSVCDVVSGLRAKSEEVNETVPNSVFKSLAVGWNSNTGDVTEAFKRAEKEMRLVLDRLNWWRMLWRVDEISFLVSGALENVWCKELEKKLILQTGRLSALQESLNKTTYDFLATLTTTAPSFKLSVLQNTLNQLTSTPSYPLTPLSLTFPIHARKQQLRYPTTRLHLAGQRSALRMGGGFAACSTFSWFGWAGWLTGNGDALFGFMGMDAVTAMGVGMFGAAATVRWSMAKWERAKKRWWEDWRRVGDGLERDLKNVVEKAVVENVVIVPEKASNELADAVATRKEEVEGLKDELAILIEDLESIEKRMAITSHS